MAEDDLNNLLWLHNNAGIKIHCPECGKILGPIISERHFANKAARSYEFDYNCEHCHEELQIKVIRKKDVPKATNKPFTGYNPFFTMTGRYP